MKTVQIAQLKDALSQHLRAVERGEAIEVTDRARPIAWIVPVPSDESPIEIIPPRRPFTSLRTKRYPPARWGVRSLDLLLAERGRR
jgi:prevent-host-death family protein